MKLITEINEECEILTETAEDGKKSHYIHGIFMQGDLKNRNGRVYPSAILQNEMVRYDKDFIKTRRALGELGHPQGPQINHDRASHLMTEMTRDGSNFIGKAKILSSPMGKIVESFINDGVQLGVSTRGLGSVKQSGTGLMEVQNDFHLAAIDIVSDPSGPNCFVNGIMENTEYFYDIASGNWKVQEKLEETVKELKKEYKATVKKVVDEAKAYRIFESFIASLKN
jgi:hypothetical protein